MRKQSKGLLIVLTLTFVLVAVPITWGQDQPFGGKEDVAFAEKLWKAIDGYEGWMISSDYFPGQSPHGEFLRNFYNIVNIDGESYHVIIKDNYGGEGATMETVSKSPDDYLAAVTVMVQMDEGYDPDNDNWFWAKYLKDGSLDKNAKGMKMAGRVAKGADKGCIACHLQAKGNDYFFTNDRK